MDDAVTLAALEFDMAGTGDMLAAMSDAQFGELLAAVARQDPLLADRRGVTNATYVTSAALIELFLHQRHHHDRGDA